MTIQQHTSDFTNVNPADAGGGALPKYLNTLFGDYPGSPPIDVNGELTEFQNIQDIPPDARALPSNQDGVFFFIDVIENAGPDEYHWCGLEPSMVMFNAEQKIMILVYALVETCKDQQAIAQLLNIFAMGLNEGLPLPGQDGWDVRYPGNEFYTAQQLLDANESAQPESEPEHDGTTKFYQAVIKTPFKPEDYAGKTIKVAFGKHCNDKNWVNYELPILDLARALSTHAEGQKDGPANVYAELVDHERRKHAVKGITAIGLDVDTGTRTEDIDAAVAKLGCVAFRHTSYSNLKTETLIKKDVLFKFDESADTITTDLVRRYLSQKKYVEDYIVETAEYAGDDFTSDGIMARISHAPWPKNRVIIPLTQPYDIATASKTQAEAMANWAKYIAAMAAKLGLPFDPSCVDPSRLLYLPRHPEGGDFSASVFGGPLFDLKTLQIDDPFEALANAGKSKGKTTSTEAGKKLIPRYKQVIQRHMLADFLRDYAPETRSDGGTKFSPPCPFEDSHREKKPGDTAFYVMNAGDTDAPVPIAQCQHAGCRDYNIYDFVAQMMEIQWFGKAELFDENYFPQMWDDGKEICPTPPDWVWGVGPDNGKPDPGQKAILDGILSDIGLLNKSTASDEDARRIVHNIIKAKPDKYWVINALNKLGDKVLGREAVKNLYDELKPKAVVPAKQNRVQSKLEIEVCERLCCEALHYPATVISGGGSGNVVVTMHDGRFYLVEQHDGFAFVLCSPTILVSGIDYVERDQQCGKLVKFLNGKGECVEVSFPSRLLVENSGKEILAKLQDAGWYGGKKGEEFVLEMLKHAHAPAIKVHDTGGFKGDAYLFLSGVSVPAGLELSSQTKSPGPASAGTMEDAKAATAALFANPKLVPVQAGYLAGLAGIIAGAALDDTLFYEFFGPSTKGKTTAEQMGLSHHGDPRLTNGAKKQGGLLYDGDGTVNSFESVAKRCSSGAVAFDEWATPGAKANQRSVFSGYSGTGKRRQNRDTTDKTTASWGGGAILVSAERCLSQRLAEEGVVQLGGLTVRLLSIRVGPEHEIPKDEFKPVKALLDNYGHIGPAFVSYMITQKWYNDPARIKARIEELQDELMEDTLGRDAQKLRASRPVAYLILAAEFTQEAGLIPATFDAKALAKTLWQAFLESDLAPIAPAKRGVEALVNWLLGNRDGEVHNYNESEDDKIKNRCPALAYYGANAHVPAEEGAKGAVYTADGWIMANVPVYVVRADIIEEKAGGAVGKRELLEELEAQGKLARKPATLTQRTWNSFPRLGKVQYVVLAASEIDADA